MTGSHAGSHGDEQPSGVPDSHGQRVVTSPRSRTDLNEAGCRYRNLRICAGWEAESRRARSGHRPAAILQGPLLLPKGHTHAPNSSSRSRAVPAGPTPLDLTRLIGMRLGAVPAVIFLGVSVSRSRPPRAGGAFRASLPRPAPPGSGPASRSIGSGSHQEDGSMPGLDQEA